MKVNKFIFIPIIPMCFIGIITSNALNKTMDNTEVVETEYTPSGIKSIKYKLDGATKQGWTDYTTPFTITNKGVTIITSLIEDNAGNQVYKSSIAKVGVNIDLEKDNINSGIKSIKYKLEGATKQGWTDYTTPFTITNKGVTYITTIVEDNAGNIEQKYSITKIGSQTIAGIKYLKYKLEGATKKDWTDYTEPFTINNEGITLITTRAEDNAGNITEEFSMARIGTEIGAGIESLTSGIKSIIYKLEGATKQDWTEYTQPFTISSRGITFMLAKATDMAGNFGEATSVIKIGTEEENSTSGIDRVEYKLDGAIKQDWTDYTEPFNLNGNGFLMIMARAYDKAGNMADDISYVQATVLGSSGIEKIEYKLDGATKQDWTEYKGVFTIKNVGITSIMARAYDNAGNVAYEHSSAKIGFDKAYISGIDRVEYKLEGATEQDWTTYNGAFYVTKEGITKITARAYDKAGNLSQEVTGQVKLDKTAPINNSILIELL